MKPMLKTTLSVIALATTAGFASAHDYKAQLNNLNNSWECQDHFDRGDAVAGNIDEFEFCVWYLNSDRKGFFRDTYWYDLAPTGDILAVEAYNFTSKNKATEAITVALTKLIEAQIQNDLLAAEVATAKAKKEQIAAQLELAEASVESLEAEKQELIASLATAGDELEAKVAELMEADATITEQRDAIAAKDIKIDMLNGIVETQAQTIMNQVASLGALQSEINALMEDKETLENEKATLENTIITRDGTITDRDNTITSLNTRIGELDAEIVRLAGLRADMRLELDNLEEEFEAAGFTYGDDSIQAIFDAGKEAGKALIEQAKADATYTSEDVNAGINSRSIGRFVSGSKTPVSVFENNDGTLTITYADARKWTSSTTIAGSHNFSMNTDAQIVSKFFSAGEYYSEITSHSGFKNVNGQITPVTNYSISIDDVTIDDDGRFVPLSIEILGNSKYAAANKAAIKEFAKQVAKAAIKESFNGGYVEGYADGYDDGYEDGYNDGYKDGFRDGVDSVTVN